METLHVKIGKKEEVEKWDRRYVSSLIDIARDYFDRGDSDLAEQFIKVARQYDNGRYKNHVEDITLRLGISRAFEVYDDQQKRAAS